MAKRMNISYSLFKLYRIKQATVFFKDMG